MSRPSKTTRPKVGSTRRRMRRPSVLLPQPLSPTRPSVSPRRTRIETPSTARTTSVVRAKSPRLDGEVLRQLSVATSVRGRSPRPAAVLGETRASSVIARTSSRAPAARRAARRRRRAGSARAPRSRTCSITHRAAVGEAAARGEVREVGHHPFDRPQADPLRRLPPVPVAPTPPLPAASGCSRAARACRGAWAARRGRPRARSRRLARRT